MMDLEKEVPSEGKAVGVESRSDSDDDRFDWTEEEERALRHKMDWHIVPLTIAMYLVCFLDRINIGNARIQGLATDLGLVGVQFNWALSIFYIIYLVVDIPSNMILKRVGPRFYLPFLVCFFGVVSIGTAFVRSFGGLMVARVFLGVAEGGAMPGLAFFLSCFYKREEMLFRIGLLFCSASLAGAFGGLLATALSLIPDWGVAGSVLHTWRNIFFFEGLVTVIVGLLVPIWLPNSPASAWFLDARERRMAVERLARESEMGSGHHAEKERVTLADLRSAIFCVHNWTCALGFFFANISVQSISLFLPTILNDLKWTATKAQLLTVPPYAAAALFTVIIAVASDRTKQRGIYLAVFALFAVVGFAVLRWDTAVSAANVKYMAVFFAMVGAFPGGPGFMSWSLNNSAGPSVRAVSASFVTAIGTIGGIVATWTYTPGDAPNYPIGHSINLGGNLIVFVLSVFGIFWCIYENRARAAGKRDYRLEGLSEEDISKLGHHSPAFRYMP